MYRINTNNKLEDKIKIIRELLDICIVFAASDMCHEGSLEDALRNFSLSHAVDAIEYLNEIEDILKFAESARLILNLDDNYIAKNL